MRDAKMRRSWRDGVKSSSENLLGMTLQGEDTREAPAQAELRPTCAGTGIEKPYLRRATSPGKIHRILITDQFIAN
jgi:hypothetical protein